MSDLLQDLITPRLFLKRVEDISEEVRDAVGICVVLQDQSWGEISNYCFEISPFTLRVVTLAPK